MPPSNRSSEPSGASSFLEREDVGAVTVARLNRPEVRNAINDDMRAELIDLLEEVEGDASVGSLVVTGNGRAFCAGGDIRAMQERLGQPPGDVAGNGWLRQRRTHHAITALHELTKPTIAAVNGPATGLGCDLALACDFIVASSDAFFEMSYVQRGLIPDGGGLYFLPRRVGLSRAKDLIFSGRPVEPDEALAMGLVDRVVEPSELLASARSWATELSGRPKLAQGLSKTLLNRSFELGLRDVFALGSQAQAMCYTSDEHAQAVGAFLDRHGSRE